MFFCNCRTAYLHLLQWLSAWLGINKILLHEIIENSSWCFNVDEPTPKPASTYSGVKLNQSENNFSCLDFQYVNQHVVMSQRAPVPLQLFILRLSTSEYWRGQPRQRQSCHLPAVYRTLQCNHMTKWNSAHLWCFFFPGSTPLVCSPNCFLSLLLFH